MKPWVVLLLLTLVAAALAEGYDVDTSDYDTDLDLHEKEEEAEKKLLTEMNYDGPFGCTDRQKTDKRDIEALVKYIEKLQYNDMTKTSFGGIRVHTRPDHTYDNLHLFWQMVPYKANLAVWGLLTTDSGVKLDVARRYMQWYFAHLDDQQAQGAGQAYQGHVLNYWATDMGNHETLCPPGMLVKNCYKGSDEDATAGTFLGMVEAYWREGGDEEFLKEHKKHIQMVGDVLVTLQDDHDGLTTSTASSHVKYVSNNAEALWGMRAIAVLEHELFHDQNQAELYEAALTAGAAGLHKTFYDAKQRTYHTRVIGHHAEGGNPATWYPDALSMIYPTVFFAPGARAEVLETVTRAHPTWDEAVIDPHGRLFPQMAQAAVQVGDCKAARRLLNLIKQKKFIPTEASVEYAVFDHPWTIEDAGWMLRVLSSLNSFDVEVPHGEPEDHLAHKAIDVDVTTEADTDDDYY